VAVVNETIQVSGIRCERCVGRLAAALRGRRSLWRLLDFLTKIEQAGSSNLTQSLRSFSIKSSGKGIVVVLSDFMDKGGYEEALRYLVARQMDIYVIQILSQEEIEPDVVGDLKLTDVADGDVAAMHPANCEIRDRTIASGYPLSSDPMRPASIMAQRRASFNPGIVVKSRWLSCFRGGIIGAFAGLIFRNAPRNTDSVRYHDARAAGPGPLPA